MEINQRDEVGMSSSGTSILSFTKYSLLLTQDGCTVLFKACAEYPVLVNVLLEREDLDVDLANYVRVLKQLSFVAIPVINFFPLDGRNAAYAGLPRLQSGCGAFIAESSRNSSERTELGRLFNLRILST